MSRSKPKYAQRSMIRFFATLILSSPFLLLGDASRTLGAGLSLALGSFAFVLCAYSFLVPTKCHVIKNDRGECTRNSLGVLGACDSHYDKKLDAAWLALGKDNVLAFTLVTLRVLDRQRKPGWPEIPDPGEPGYYDNSRWTMRFAVAGYQVWFLLVILSLTAWLIILAVRGIFD